MTLPAGDVMLRPLLKLPRAIAVFNLTGERDRSMKPYDFLKRPRNFEAAPPLIALLVLVGVAAVGFASGAARSGQEGAAAHGEREFKTTFPARVPLKVKVKDEKSFKDPLNRDWLREMEIEIKNTGSKPIYYLYVVIRLPEMIVAGHQLGFQLKYGRRDLLFLDTPVKPEDVPILPGESITLRPPQSDVRAYEKIRDTEGRPDQKKVEFDFQFINFGDGTGIQGTDGHPAPKRS
jgi:hypothetical protein